MRSPQVIGIVAELDELPGTDLDRAVVPGPNVTGAVQETHRDMVRPEDRAQPFADCRVAIHKEP